MKKEYFIADFETARDVQKIFSSSNDELVLITKSNIKDTKFLNRRDELQKAKQYNIKIISRAFMVINPRNDSQLTVESFLKLLTEYLKKAYALYCKFKAGMHQLIANDGGFDSIESEVRNELKNYGYTYIASNFDGLYISNIASAIDFTFAILSKNYRLVEPSELIFKKELKSNLMKLNKVLVK